VREERRSKRKNKRTLHHNTQSVNPFSSLFDSSRLCKTRPPIRALLLRAFHKSTLQAAHISPSLGGALSPPDDGQTEEVGQKEIWRLSFGKLPAGMHHTFPSRAKQNAPSHTSAPSHAHARS
jgi:hypothetical protein